MNQALLRKQRRRRQYYGVGGLVVVLVVVAVLVATYLRAFTSSVDVTLYTDRSGLLLDTGSDVRLNGVPIGTVTGLAVAGPHRARVELAINPSDARLIPDNSTATILATTVFGPKYVEINRPTTAAGPMIEAGDTISGSVGTTEINDVFQNAMKVLTAIHPAELDQALTSIAQNVQGRGQELGNLVTNLNGYLGSLETMMPTITDALSRGASVTATYNNVTIAVLSILRNFATTSTTISASHAQLGKFLTALTEAMNSTTTLADALEVPAIVGFTKLAPVLSLLREYSPELGCVLVQLRDHDRRLTDAIGNKFPAAADAFAGFLPGQAGYTAANLPKLVSGVGPRCYPNSTATNALLPHYNFNDGTAGIYDNLAPTVPSNPISLYESAIKDFFGQTGLNAILPSLGGAR